MNVQNVHMVHTPGLGQAMEYIEDTESFDLDPGGTALNNMAMTFVDAIGLPLLIVVLASFCVQCFCIGRCIFVCGGGLNPCGKTYPTPDRIETEDGEFKNQMCGFDKDTGQYGIRGKLSAYCCMLSFMIITCMMVFVGHTRGNEKITSSFIPLTKTLDPAVS